MNNSILGEIPDFCIAEICMYYPYSYAPINAVASRNAPVVTHEYTLFVITGREKDPKQIVNQNECVNPSGL